MDLWCVALNINYDHLHAIIMRYTSSKWIHVMQDTIRPEYKNLAHTKDHANKY